MTYDYRKEMIKDIKDYIWMNDMRPEKGMTKDDYIEYLTDELWGVDDVTGNGLNFYATEEQCEEYVCHNLTLYFQAADELDEWSHFEGSTWMYKNPAQHMDATIRCYLLSECLNTIFEKKDIEEDIDDDDEEE